MHKKEMLHKIISAKAIHRYPKSIIVSTRGTVSQWLMDMRASMLDGQALDIFSDIFWEMMKEKFPFQIGGIELSSVPMIASILQKGAQKGFLTNGFIIRKERKTTGLCRRIEGEIDPLLPIVLVDDIINGANSLETMCSVLEDEKLAATHFFTLLDFEDNEGKKRLQEKNIEHSNIFTLKDFHITKSSKKKENDYWNKKLLPTTQQLRFDFPDYFHTKPTQSLASYNNGILFLSENASLFFLDEKNKKTEALFNTNIVLPESRKSNLITFENFAYWCIHGTELICLNLETKKIKWRFSFEQFEDSIKQTETHIFICSYDFVKNVYTIIALNKETGEKTQEWEFLEKPLWEIFQNKIYGISKNSIFILEENGAQKKLFGPLQANISQLINIQENFLFCILDEQKLVKISLENGEIFPIRRTPLLDQSYTDENLNILTTIKNKILIYNHKNELLKEDSLLVRIISPFLKAQKFLYFFSSYQVFRMNTETLETELLKHTNDRILDIYVNENTLLIHTQGNHLIFCKID